MSEGQNNLPSDRESALSRIEAIDADMIAIQRMAATQGVDLRREWDELSVERTALETTLWRGTKK
jgi:hypothetical protein